MAKKHRKKRKMSENFPLSRKGRKGKSKKRRRSRGRGLSELFGGGTSAMMAGRHTLSGTAGGFLAGLLNDVLPDKTNFFWRSVANLVPAYLVSGTLKMPNTGAGMAGAFGVIAYQKLRSGNLQEEYDYANPDVLSEYPMFADAQGNPMALAEDGNLYYLDEGGNLIDPNDELFSADREMYLQEGIYPEGGIYPQ